MTRSVSHTLFTAVILCVLTGCAAPAAPTPPADQASSPTAQPAPTTPPTVEPTATVAPTATTAPTATASPTPPPSPTPWAGKHAGLVRWRAADNAFQDWTLSGVTLEKGLLKLDPASAAQETDPFGAKGFHTNNFYNGGTYQVGEAASPEMSAEIPFTEAIASWNAETPDGAWVETLIRVRLGSRWTKWYNLGVWASGKSVIKSHSVDEQEDEDADVATDTLTIKNQTDPVSAYQLKVRLFSADGKALPGVRLMSLTFSLPGAARSGVSAGDPSLWDQSINVPSCSQMVFPDGGEVWCSPTSTQMVLAYWGWKSGSTCAAREPIAVEGTYDWVYTGNGNWPFNTAFAAAQGMEAYVARFESLAEVEPWIAEGIPIIISVAWKKGQLINAATPSTDGHIIVLSGFDKNGNVLVNDPAAPDDKGVRRMYRRAELEGLWLRSSKGTAYVIYPQGHKTPVLTK